MHILGKEDQGSKRASFSIYDNARKTKFKSWKPGATPASLSKVKRCIVFHWVNL